MGLERGAILLVRSNWLAAWTKWRKKGGKKREKYSLCVWIHLVSYWSIYSISSYQLSLVCKPSVLWWRVDLPLNETCLDCYLNLLHSLEQLGRLMCCCWPSKIMPPPNPPDWESLWLAMAAQCRGMGRPHPKLRSLMATQYCRSLH